MSVRFAYRGAAAARFAGLSSEAAPSEGRFGVAVAVFFMEKGMAALAYRETGGSRKQQRGVEGGCRCSINSSCQTSIFDAWKCTAIQ